MFISYYISSYLINPTLPILSLPLFLVLSELANRLNSHNIVAKGIHVFLFPKNIYITELIILSDIIRGSPELRKGKCNFCVGEFSYWGYIKGGVLILEKISSLWLRVAN